MYGYPTLSVVDGSAVSANLGVNPSLTITAHAERAAAMWPNKGEVDLRADQAQGFRRIQPVAPNNPVVPEGAAGTLRLPVVEITSKDTAGLSRRVDALSSWLHLA